MNNSKKIEIELQLTPERGKKTIYIGAKIPVEIDKQLEKIVEELKMTKSEIIRQLITKFVANFKK